MGGSALVLNTWPGTLDDLAARFERMQTAEEYDPSWEDDIVATSAIWELYGHMDPANRPILNSQVMSGLDSLGFNKPADYQNRRGFERFADAYDSIVGHATAATDHEVPWYFELEQFLVMAGTENQYDIHSALPVDPEYPKVVGWEAEGHAGKIVFRDLAPLLEKYTESKAGGGFEKGETGLWGDYWESWKWTHADHIRTNVRTEYEITDLSGDELESFLKQFKNAPDVELSSTVPTYLLGGRSGGILWNDFKNRSLEHPHDAAEVLSMLFDENKPLTDRLARFNDFYAPLETSPGPLLSLATMFLMLTYPTEYVMYKYGKFSSFFEEYSDYNVSTGFEPKQYWVLNEASQRIVRRLNGMFDEDPRIDTEASMLDVHTLIWVTVGVENL
ncbi:hypothetical protein D8Y22_02615 [Salinadaptatus halalkaliphilus]|uniref:Uncharacterized protein n=1 Tax=Salinadaptatus halalkaliphilus TaxID=2419781 RepID=A0A4S3TPS1_9EURY|nr:hypothetical protein [Salinadaptatus halalkaliphilus]THE66379.1 hypothetical protein D8Y22_02615 [Salinadaptatus halalkaliphilus]